MLKITVEMDDFGNVKVDSDQDQLDVAEAGFLLDLAKMYIISEWAQNVEKNVVPTPVDVDDTEVLVDAE